MLHVTWLFWTNQRALFQYNLSVYHIGYLCYQNIEMFENNIIRIPKILLSNLKQIFKIDIYYEILGFGKFFEQTMATKLAFRKFGGKHFFAESIWRKNRLEIHLKTPQCVYLPIFWPKMWHFKKWKILFSNYLEMVKMWKNRLSD